MATATAAKSASKTSITKSPRPGKNGTEPTFEKLSTALAEADAKARSASSDAGQARAERSTVAVSTIKAAYAEKLDGTAVRTALIGAGVLKGTVSKIVTVLTALQDRVITPVDVKSLNGAYSLVKQIEKAASAPAPAAAPSTPAPAPTVAPTTPEDAMKIIVGVIKSEKDPDKAFKLAGDWIAKVTNAITEAIKEIEDGEE